MSAATQNHTNNIIIGSGEVYLDLLENGEYTGERYLGDSTGATLAVAIERTQIFSGDGATARRLVDQVRQVTHTLGCTLQDISIENLALFIAGDASSRTVAANAVADEAFKVHHGRWYQLGASATNPGGVSGFAEAGFAISTGADEAAAKAAAALSDAQVTANVVLDRDRGRIRIKDAAPQISNGAYVSVDYTPVAATIDAAKMTTPQAVEGAFRYVETEELPGAGKGRNIYARLCSIAGSGEMALKSRDTAQQIGLSVEVQEPTGGWPSITIDGIPQ